MMRIYVVTPEGPLKVSVNPLIQPNPPPCPTFHPGTGREIDLTSGHIWVLRLPYPLCIFSRCKVRLTLSQTTKFGQFQTQKAYR